MHFSGFIIRIHSAWISSSFPTSSSWLRNVCFSESLNFSALNCFSNIDSWKNAACTNLNARNVCFDETIVVECNIFWHFVQSKICTNRPAFRPKNVTCVLISFYYLGLLARENVDKLSSFGTAIWKNIGSNSADQAIWCSRKRHMIPIRVCCRSSPEKILSLLINPWYFAAALHTLLAFSGFWGLMTWWYGKYHCSLSLVWFRPVW